MGEKPHREAWLARVEVRIYPPRYERNDRDKGGCTAGVSELISRLIIFRQNSTNKDESRQKQTVERWDKPLKKGEKSDII